MPLFVSNSTLSLDAFSVRKVAFLKRVKLLLLEKKMMLKSFDF